MAFEDIKYIKIPITYEGFIVKPDAEEAKSGLHIVNVVTDSGVISRLPCRLCFSPGAETNFNEYDPVLVLAYMWYYLPDQKFKDIVSDGNHIILGRFRPFTMTPDAGVKNVNASVAGGSYNFLHPRNHCGVMVEDSGAIRFITNGLVNRRMSPLGFGAKEQSDTSQAQNFHRVIMNQEAQHRAREYFGMYRGKDDAEMMSNAASGPTGKKMLMAYKRFVPQSLDPNKWVSTCEGTYGPWIGPNNEVEKIGAGDEDILFSKVIHNTGSRITVTGGKLGRDFLNMRIDTVAPMSEKMLGPGPSCTPPASSLKASISISESGEMVAELGIDAKLKPAAVIKVLKTGEIEIMAGTGVKLLTKNFVIESDETNIKSQKIVLDGEVDVKGMLKQGGKYLATADLVDWLQTNMPTLFVGAATPSPAIAAEFVPQSIIPGIYRTDSVYATAPTAIVAVAETEPLKSTS